MPVSGIIITRPINNELVSSGSIYTIKISTGVHPTSSGEPRYVNLYYSTASGATSPFNTSQWILISSSYDIYSNYYEEPGSVTFWGYSASWEVPFAIVSESYIGMVTSSNLTDAGYISNMFIIDEGYSSGSGLIDNPYIIYTPKQLKNISNMFGFNYYKLMADLDMSSYPYWIAIKSPGSTTVEAYASLDGNNKSISNLNFTSESFDNATGSFRVLSLFGNITSINDVTDYVYIKDLTLLNTKINISSFDDALLTGDIYASSLCSDFYGYSTIISGNGMHNINVIGFTASIVDNTSIINNIYISPICNFSRYATMSLCIASSSKIEFARNGVNANVYASGILNWISNTTYITSCSTRDCDFYVNTSNFATIYLTGLIGVSNNSADYIKYNSVKNSTLIYSGTNATLYLDGLIGDLYTTASDSYIFNTILSSSDDGNGFIAGLADYNSAGSYLKNIYVSAEYYSENFPSQSFYVMHTPSEMENVYYESRSYMINDPQVSASAGLTSVQMLDSSSYIGFDFQNVWSINPSIQSGYPYLSWETPATILPSLTILYPNGGELLFYNEMIPISWSFTSGTL